MASHDDQSRDGGKLKTNKVSSAAKTEDVVNTPDKNVPKTGINHFAELPIAGRLELPSTLTFPMQVMTMNASGPAGGDGTASSRRKYIADVILNYNPQILLFQEFQWQGIKGKTWKDTPIPDRYVYTGNKEASIIYDAERFCLKELAQTKLQRPLDELRRKGKVSQGFTPLPRSTIRLLEQNGSTSLETFKILVVSWHGVHSRTKDTEKKIQFQYLQVYLKELSEREEATVLLGGDFNINIDLIRDVISPDFILYEYSPSERRKGKVIDYFIASPKLSLTNVQYIELAGLNDPKDKQILIPYHVLDHDPVSATMVKNKSTEDLTLPSMTSSLKTHPTMFTRAS
ncbi:uncharacterized protein [Argopecten irradians]|uniref:uncharacterized protein n=1 Tax=Argopecten irradians TaxID=31199 RepID=UPI00371BC3E7